MFKFANKPLLDIAILQRMNDEFRSGAYDELSLTPAVPIDPKSDPFDRNYEWLEPDLRSTDTAEISSAVLSQPSSERWRIAAAALRRTALAGSLAGDTDAEIFQQWLGKGFVGLCHEAGPSGVELLETIRGDRELLPERIEAIRGVFRETLPAASFTEEEEIAIATAIVQALMLPR